MRKNNKILPRFLGGKDEYSDTIEFLKHHEGFNDVVYKDGNGIPTIGYGFTDPSLVKKGRISEKAALARLRQEVITRDAFLKNLKNWDLLGDGAKTALRSYYYNYPAGFRDTTKFMKAWNAGDYAEAIRQVDAGMNDPNNPGLRKRRLAEQGLLNEDPYIQSIINQKPRYTTTVAEENAKMLFQPWSNYHGTDYPINNLAPASISSWNSPQSPAYTPVEYSASLSYLRLPDIKDVIEQSIMTPRFKNGKLPVFAGGTDGVLNNISEEYIPLVGNTYQPMINDAKQQVAKFAIDDYAYRILKQHPEVTKEQLYGAYNSTPYIGSDSRKGTTVGQYWHGEDDGYGRRVMIYPRSMKSDDPEFNLQDRIQSTVLHESNHLLRDAVLGGKYTDKEREYLENAYPGVPINEAAALNAQIREKLSNVYGKGAVGEKLDATLEKVRKDKGMLNEMMFHLNNLNGYGHADKVNGQWDPKTIDSMVNSLMNVASIQNKPSRGLFYAANGKSPIHIKPANRGKFTALKKRTGHSASWFKKNGTPAQKKMAVFALNARKWSH